MGLQGVHLFTSGILFTHLGPPAALFSLWQHGSVFRPSERKTYTQVSVASERREEVHFRAWTSFSRLLIQKRDMCLEPEVQDEGSEWIPCPKLWLEQLLHDLRGQQTDVYCSFGLEKHSLQAVSPLINRDGMCRGLVHSGVCRVILLSRIRNIF